MIEINWNGSEMKMETVEAAEKFARILLEKNYGSDIWVNDKLHQTIMINAKSGEAVCFLYSSTGNTSYKMDRG